MTVGYEPEVDDYVRWTNPLGQVHEGWVYFKGDPVNNSKRARDGWNPINRYITIEIGVRPKDTCVYTSGKPMRHKMIHTLLLCYESHWNELELIKKRKNKSDNIIIWTAEDGDLSV